MRSQGLLLDSDVLAEIRKASPNPRVLAFLRRRSYQLLYISSLSLGQLKSLYPYPETDRWLAELMDRFSGHILDVDAKVSLEWSGRQLEPALHLVGSARSQALPTAALEGLMAATASVHKLELVSSQAENYRRWGLLATNPWEED